MPVVISENIVLGPTTGGQVNFPLSHARIGYDSIATFENVTATSALPGFPATDAVSPLTYEQWRPETLPAVWTVDAGRAKPVDYVGIYSPNLSDVGAVVKVEYSLDNLTWVTVSEYSPDNNLPLMAIFDQTVARYWRITVDAINGTPYFSVVKVGSALQMERQIYGGVTPIQMARRTSFNNNRSDKGQFLGRSKVREGVSLSLSWRHLTADWYRRFFEPFARVARTEPFFIAWRPEDYPQEVGYCWTTEDLRPVNMGIRDYLEVSMNLEGLQND